MSKHRNIRVSNELDSAVVAIQKMQNRSSWSETAKHLILVGLETEGQVHFNRACTLLGITWQRATFSDWRQENGVPTFATLPEWEGYLEAFETSDDDQDLRDTQQDALR